MSTIAKVAWIDRYRFRLIAVLPDLSPFEAMSLAVDAYDLERSTGLEPEVAADAHAADKARMKAGRTAEQVESLI